jgi:hypothetical protein
MKPLSSNSRQSGSLRREQRPSESRFNQPSTDCRYHANSLDLRAAAKVTARPPSLRDLSNEFLGGEMKRVYVTEALLFAIIVAVSAWPIIPTMRALSTLFK